MQYIYKKVFVVTDAVAAAAAAAEHHKSKVTFRQYICMAKNQNIYKFNKTANKN